TYNAGAQQATLTPTSVLAYRASYTATIKGGATGVKDTNGNPMVGDYTWTFTTLPPPACPCSIWSSQAAPAVAASGDPNSVELGVKFRTESAGYITGIRFYKGPGNTGTHVGDLWTSTGQLLARATFANETASGWQTVSFSSPVPVQANKSYVASYLAPV